MAFQEHFCTEECRQMPREEHWAVLIRDRVRGLQEALAWEHERHREVISRADDEHQQNLVRLQTRIENAQRLCPHLSVADGLCSDCGWSGGEA